LQSVDAATIEIGAQRATHFSAMGALHTSLGQGPRTLVPQRSGALKGRSIPPVLPSAGGVDYSPANNTSHASPRCAPGSLLFSSESKLVSGGFSPKRSPAKISLAIHHPVSEVEIIPILLSADVEAPPPLKSDCAETEKLMGGCSLTPCSTSYFFGGRYFSGCCWTSFVITS
jgi:hypothetical protein